MSHCRCFIKYLFWENYSRRSLYVTAIDVGNTNITFGIFEKKVLITTFRMTTKQLRTSDEYGIGIIDMLERNQIFQKDVKDVIIASVVPDVMHSLNNAIIKYFGITPIIVGPGIKTGIRVVTGAYALYGGPVLVLDFGTATTYDLVDASGAFVAGVTAPGIRISAKALWEDAAKLPKIEICKPKSILAQETISSMQAGLVYGQIGQTEYIVRNMAKEAGYKELKVVATGGLGRIIANETDCIDIYDPNLTLTGLRLIFEKQN